MRFSVIIATLGRPDVLRRTIDSVVRTEPLPTELIVVDGDPERSSERATEGEFRLPVRYMTAPKGLPKQRNAGLDRAEGDVVVFVDDDVEIPGDTFSVLGSVFADPSVLGATARIVEPASTRLGKKHSPVRRLLPGGGEEGRFTRFGYPRRLIDLETERDIDFMHGSFMSVRTAAAREIRFDERLPGYALAEDEDFSYRVSRRGRIRFVPRLHVVHAKEGHGSRDARAFGRTVVVNRAYLFRKNFRGGVLARFQFVMLIALFVAHRLVNREWSEARGLLEGAVASLRRPLESFSGDPSGRPSVTFVSSHARSGGSERYLVTLLAALDTEEIAGVVALEEGPLVSELRSAGYPITVLPTSGSKLSMVRSARELRRHLRDRPSAVVHANGVKAGLVTALARVAMPMVWVKHDFSFDGRIARAVARRSAVVVGVSDAVLSALGPVLRERARVIYTGATPSGIERDGASRRLHAELGADSDDVLIGIVGRLHPVKGHLDLIAAAEKVISDAPNARFVFVGGADPTTPDHGERVRRAASTLGEHAHLLDHRDDIAGVIAGLDIGVMTSHRDRGSDVEAFPLTALEMLAGGTPIVAYSSGGIPELVGDCGVLVPTGDVDALAREIAGLIADPERRARLSKCGPQRVTREFSPEAMIAAMRRAYEDAAS